MTRQRFMQDFLEQAGWQHAVSSPLAGDASPRCYRRLVDPASGASRVLMDAPPDMCGPLEPFLRATGFLAGAGCCPPHIHAIDTDHGFLLLEDLGDDLVATVLGNRPELEVPIYSTAIDLLLHLRGRAPGSGFPEYSAQLQSELAGLAIEWYWAGVTGEEPEPGFIEAFRTIIRDLVSGLDGEPVFVHRDYHAENLVWLPDRRGIRRLGVLDYQDGSTGHPAYDLVSILEDARRDIPEELQLEMMARYARISGQREDDLRYAMAVCGAQRNLRIVGIFARLAIRDGKPRYLDHLPRVWRYLSANLSHPALARLSAFVGEHLPPPGREVLAGLRTRSP